MSIHFQNFVLSYIIVAILSSRINAHLQPYHMVYFYHAEEKIDSYVHMKKDVRNGRQSLLKKVPS